MNPTNHLDHNAKASSEQFALVIDARKMPCPMPLLKLKQGLNKIEKGQRLLMLATDPVSPRDCVSFTERCGHLLCLQQNGQEFHFTVQKG